LLLASKHYLSFLSFPLSAKHLQSICKASAKHLQSICKAGGGKAGGDLNNN